MRLLVLVVILFSLLVFDPSEIRRILPHHIVAGMLAFVAVGVYARLLRERRRTRAVLKFDSSLRAASELADATDRIMAALGALAEFIGKQSGVRLVLTRRQAGSLGLRGSASGDAVSLQIAEPPPSGGSDRFRIEEGAAARSGDGAEWIDDRAVFAGRVYADPARREGLLVVWSLAGNTPKGDEALPVEGAAGKIVSFLDREWKRAGYQEKVEEARRAVERAENARREAERKAVLQEEEAEQAAERAEETRAKIAEAERLFEEARREYERQSSRSTEELMGAYARLDEREEELKRRLSERIGGIEMQSLAEVVLDETFFLEMTLNAGLGETQAEIGSIMLLDPTTDELEIVVSRGLSDEVVKTTRIAVGEAIAGYVAQQKKPLLVADIESEPRFQGVSQVRNRRTSFICVPIVGRDRVLGVMNANNKAGGGAFTNRDLAVMEWLAGRAAHFLESLSVLGASSSGAISIKNYMEQTLTGRFVRELPLLEPQGTVQRVTAVFVQIKGVPRMVSWLPIGAVIETLNRIYKLLSGIVTKFRGTVDRYGGDSMVAVFGLPFAGAEDAERAVRSAIEIVVRFLKQRNPDEIRMDLGIAVGISTGDVVVGVVGTPGNRRHTVVGDVVEIGRRLQMTAQTGQVLIDHATFEKLEGRLEAEPSGTVSLPNNPAVPIYGVRRFKKTTPAGVPAPKDVAVPSMKIDGPGHPAL
jgi:class 3 adenylate cyclase